jgi:hypothetical protein
MTIECSSNIIIKGDGAPEEELRNESAGATGADGGTKRIIYNTGGSSGGSAAGKMCEILFTWIQSSGDNWILVRTPQAYGSFLGGGWAHFRLLWTGYHASNCTMKMWDAVFHNNHSRIFSWSKSSVTTIGNGSGSYSAYNYSPSVNFYKQTASGGGYTTSDQWMRNLYIKVSGYNSVGSVQRALYINACSGGWNYDIIHMGTSTPAGSLTGV